MAEKDTGASKPRFVVQYDDHPKFISTVFCSFLEHQILVDIAIRCGNQTLHAHKVILAANSLYFKEQFEKHPDTEQIIMNGMEFSTLKCIIEFMYCGETSILLENLKYVVSAAKLFQILGLQAIGSEAAGGDEIVYYPPPIFVNQKPKYASTHAQYTQTGAAAQSLTGRYHSVEYMPELPPVPLQVVSYSDLNASLIHPGNGTLPLMHVFDIRNMRYPGEKPINQIKDVLLTDMYNNVLMYKTPAGEYLNVSNEVLEAYTEKSLQFPVVDGDSKPKTNEGMRSSATDKVKIIDNILIQKKSQPDQLDQPGRHQVDNVEIMYETSDGEYLKVSKELLDSYAESLTQFQVLDDGDLARQMADVQMTSSSTENLTNIDNEELSQICQIEDGALDQLEEPGSDLVGRNSDSLDIFNNVDLPEEILEQYAENLMQLQEIDGDSETLGNIDTEKLSQAYQNEDESLDQLDLPDSDHEGIDWL